MCLKFKKFDSEKNEKKNEYDTAVKTGLVH